MKNKVISVQADLFFQEAIAETICAGGTGLDGVLPPAGTGIIIKMYG